MSEKNEASRDSSTTADSALDALEDWYHVPVLGAVLAFMFWVSVQAWDNFSQNGEVYFSGNNAYYHFREVMYTVQHWPSTMPYDVWTGFPNGIVVGQFGTLLAIPTYFIGGTLGTTSRMRFTSRVPPSTSVVFR